MKYNPVIINGENISVIEDTYLLAALLTFDPSISCIPIWNENGKVVFEVEGSISEGMRRYFSGEPAPLSVYTSKLKYIRSSIFSMRKSSASYRKGLRESFNRSFV
jgi:hypothetical protein